MALKECQASVSSWLDSTSSLRKSLPCSIDALLKDLSESYDWTNGCRKLSMAINPFMIWNANFSGESLGEADLKGAVGCFILLSWTLLLTGRAPSIAALYTALLTGIVIQYAMLQRCEGKEGKKAARVTQECLAKEALEAGLRDSRRINEPEAPAEAKEARATPSLGSVASALSFCALPLATSALIMRLMGWCSLSSLLASLPAAWCTLLVTCALLPSASSTGDRALVILPSGVLFTFLALLFLG